MSAVFDFINGPRYRQACEQGATFKRRIVLKDSEGLPLNLTGYTAKMEVRKAPGYEPALFSLTTDEDGGLTIDAASGSVEIEIDDDTTATASPGNYRYDLKIEADGKSTRVLEGRFDVTPGVTE